MKHIFRIAHCIFIMILFLGCQYDSVNEEEKHEASKASPFSMSIINHKEIQDNHFISEKLQNFFVSPQDKGKSTLYNSNYDFYVNTDYAKYIESTDGSSHSYTFLIQRDESTDVIENLVFSSLPDGSYNTSIVVYDFVSDGNLQINTASVSDIDNAPYLEKSTFSYDCTTTVTYSTTFNADCSCQYLQIDSVNTNCTYTYYDDANQLVDSNGVAGVWNNTIWVSSGGGGGSDGSSGGSGDNGDNEVRTSLLTQSHIDRLTQQTKNSLIKARIQQMESDVNTVNKEQGSEFLTNSNGYTEYQIPSSQLTFSGIAFPTAVANSQVRVHLHHNNSQTDANGNVYKLATIFSEDDIFGMAQFFHDKKVANNGQLMEADGNISSILVSRRGLYALRITDPAKAQEFYTYLASSSRNSKGETYQQTLRRGFKTNVIDKTRAHCESLGGCSEAQEEALFELYFLKFFKFFDSGMSVFVSLELDDNGDYIWMPLTN